MAQNEDEQLRLLYRFTRASKQLNMKISTEKIKSIIFKESIRVS